jgi:hypothetical protein
MTSTPCGGDLGTQFVLQLAVEVGEDEVAAEDEMERACGHRMSYVLLAEIDVLSEPRAYSQQSALLLKAALAQMRRHFSGAALWIDCLPTSLYLVAIDIGSDDFERLARDDCIGVGVAHDGERVWLFAGPATCRPHSKRWITALPGQTHQAGKKLLAEQIEDSAVAVEARDGDPTQGL